MSSRTVHPPPADEAYVSAVFRHVANDLGMILGQELSFEDERAERVSARPAGPGQVHISFKFALLGADGAERHGALLVPLPDAIAMACFLLMIPEETVTPWRQVTTIDPALKDAMLEIGSMVGSAMGSALKELELAGWSARTAGCQGVRADVRPAFPYAEGSDLVVGRARTQLARFAPFELILMLPALG